MNIYQNVPEQFHTRYLETLAMLSDTDSGNYPDESAQIVSLPQRSKKDRIGTIFRQVIHAGAAAAAIFGGALILCAANPSLAANLPVVGTVFQIMQERFGFGRIPEAESVLLIPEESASSTPEQYVANPYQASDQGIHLSVEEYYASNQAIFLGIRMVTDEPLPYDLGDNMIFLSTETYSFRADDPNRGNWNYVFERVDENTFLGIIRIDYDAIRKDIRKYTDAVQKAEENGMQPPVLSAETENQYVSYYDIPEAFDLDIEFTSLRIYHTAETVGPSKQSIKGSWRISGIPIRQSAKDMRSISVKDVNAAGFGIDHIDFSPLEMTIYPVEPSNRLTFAAVLDRDGRLLHSGGDNCYQLAIQGHDISEITIYIFDYEEYMDEIKAYTESADTASLKKILTERCLYQKSVITTE